MPRAQTSCPAKHRSSHNRMTKKFPLFAKVLPAETGALRMQIGTLAIFLFSTGCGGIRAFENIERVRILPTCLSDHLRANCQPNDFQNKLFARHFLQLIRIEEFPPAAAGRPRAPAEPSLRSKWPLPQA